MRDKITIVNWLQQAWHQAGNCYANPCISFHICHPLTNAFTEDLRKRERVKELKNNLTMHIYGGVIEGSLLKREYKFWNFQTWNYYLTQWDKLLNVETKFLLFCKGPKTFRINKHISFISVLCFILANQQPCASHFQRIFFIVDLQYIYRQW